MRKKRPGSVSDETNFSEQAHRAMSRGIRAGQVNVPGAPAARENALGRQT
jgi:hypothetical protein